MKIYSKRDVEKLLKNNGYEYSRCSGSHRIYKREGRHISIPKSLNATVIQRLVKENQLVG